MLYIYDRSSTLNLALVADSNLGRAQYLPLVECSYPDRVLQGVYLRQLHAVANSVAMGLTVQSRMKFEPGAWDRLSGQPRSAEPDHIA